MKAERGRWEEEDEKGQVGRERKEDIGVTTEMGSKNIKGMGGGGGRWT
jgi:hypothetical protein